MKFNTSLSWSLDFLRWVAAFLVVIGHLRSLMFVEYEKIESITIIDKMFYFFTGFGHESVIVFFVLSGYLVGGEFLRIDKTNKMFMIYMIKRFSRIFMVFFPALIIGGIIDLIGSHWINYGGIYQNAFHKPSMNFSVLDRLTPEIFLTNLTMMQTSLGHTLGSNGPLWSLANEWWYYMLPLLLVLFTKSQSIIIRIMSGTVVILLLYILNPNIILYFSIWLIGMGASLIQKKYPFYLIYLAIIFTLMTFVFSRFHKLNIPLFYYDVLIAISIVSLLIVLSKIQNKPIFFQDGNRRLANFSYSLYVFHFPFILIVVSLLSFISLGVNSQPSLVTYSLYGIVLGTTYLYAFVMYRLFEEKTKNVRDRLVSWLN